ncbi:MAG: 5-formyltetrahydrofolate cyclo-ligase, partial [Bacteroidales bacterium]|nr:5-formyltetrahydrofolate cyclo-ligase [Bacteroidales bacterium]
KGYYDRFLPKLPNAFRLGVCFDFQVLDTLPVDSFDQQMDEIIKA